MSRIIGPTLPTEPIDIKKNVQTESDSSDEDLYGPALPAHLKSKFASKEKPASPVELRDNAESQEFESSSDEMIGPLPVKEEDSEYQKVSSYEIEKRSLTMKRKLLGVKDSEDTNPSKREDWMIELPELHRKNFGLGPRTFNRTEKPECVGRDQWTSTPLSKVSPSPAKKTITDEELRKQFYEHQRNAKLDQIVSKHDKAKKRSVSLLEAHQKDMKKKKSIVPKERKPFDRDEDLKLNKLDDAKRKALIKKSQELNSKFKTGNQKFL